MVSYHIHGHSAIGNFRIWTLTENDRAFHTRFGGAVLRVVLRPARRILLSHVAQGDQSVYGVLHLRMDVDILIAVAPAPLPGVDGEAVFHLEVDRASVPRV